MTDMIASRLGQNVAATTPTERDLFLKVFAGEVLTAFNQRTVTMDKHIIRTIEHGKSAQFPLVGKVKAKYHKPGTEIKGAAVEHSERIIHIDDILLTDVFIASIDDAMNHYEVRSEYTKQMGRELANAADNHVLRCGYIAAKTTRNAKYKTIDQQGTIVKKKKLNTDSEALIDSIFEAAEKLDDKNVPEDDRFCYVSPTQYYLLAKNTKIMNRDWGGMGTYATADVIKVADITIVKTNNLPKTDSTGATVLYTDVETGGVYGRYKVDASNMVGLIMHRSAVGTVKLRELAMEQEYLIKYQGDLLVAKYLMGHGDLRPECAVALEVEPTK